VVGVIVLIILGGFILGGSFGGTTHGYTVLTTKAH
jgi:hypothetical protein